MKNKPALILSIALTAFVLVVLSALTMRASAFFEKTNASNPDPSVEQIITDREQEYINAINQANQQISEMQAQLEASAATESPQSAAISADEAATIAQDAAMEGYTLSGAAELVDYEGQLAYEVPFNDGLIYIDAVSGDVLFNGTIVYAPTQISASDAAYIASDYMKRQDVVNVRLAVLKGQEVYRVAFPGNNLVFVSKYGALLQVQLADSGGGNSAGNSHNDSHEEEHGDDD